jgi:Serine carboxypeptidase S28
MFYPHRNWTLSWLTEHCQSRFQIDPEPGRLNRMWHFDSLDGTSQILFTNGVNDGWYVGSFTETNNPHVAVINYPNGAHHSDLTPTWPRHDDTQDVIDGRALGLSIIKGWLDIMKANVVRGHKPH